MGCGARPLPTGRWILEYYGGVRETSSAEVSDRIRMAEERSLGYWTDAVATSAVGSMTVAELQRSLSWRITSPLRAVGTVTRRLRSTGLRRTVGLVRERLALARATRPRG